MDFSEIIITKGGGITVSEALSKELAIVIMHHIPGQEERNVKYLLKKEAIIKVDRISQIEDAVSMLLEDNNKLTFLRRRAKEISYGDSALKLADLILGY